MINRGNTATGLLLIGIGSFSTSSTFALQETDFLEKQFARTILFLGQPAFEMSRVDAYVSDNYTRNKHAIDSISELESAFFATTQNLKEEQVNLDPEFEETLNELLLYKVVTKPSKNIF
jgi:hypothetical protein